MNIFKALSNGHGRISETNLTSFLSYLLNQKSEFKESIALAFFDLIDQNQNEINLIQFLKITGNSEKERISNLSKNYIIQANPEVKVKGNDYEQIIDIVISIQNKTTNEDEIYIIVENKINSGAKNETQCVKQFISIKEDEDFKNDIPIFTVLLTIDDLTFENSFKNIKELNPNSSWLKWIAKNTEEASIYTSLQNYLSQEAIGYVPPINIETRNTLKNFLDFIWDEFFPIPKTQRNISVNGFSIVDSCEVAIEQKSITIAKYENNSIRLLNEEGEILSDPVKPFLRKVIQLMNLETDPGAPISNTRKNTRILGKEVIEEINRLK